MPSPHERDENRPAPGVKSPVPGVDDADPAALPIPETDHHVGGGAGVAHPHTVESTGTTGGVRQHPEPAPRDAAGAGGGAASGGTTGGSGGSRGSGGAGGASQDQGSGSGSGEGLVGGLSTFQVVAAVSLGAVLAAGIAAAVVAVLGEDDDEDDEPAPPKRKAPAGRLRKKAAARGGRAARPGGNATAAAAAAGRKKRGRIASPAASAAPAGPINVNEAGGDELATLPGVGPAAATAILARRPFESIDDLREVPGIGAGLLERLRPLVTV